MSSTASSTSDRRDDAAASWAAIVVTYEAGPLLLSCVRSLLADRSAGDPEVVVVDNGSRDGSTRSIRAQHPEVRVLEPGRNLGYAGAANCGVAATTAPVVVVCNADVQVERGAAATMTARLAAEPDLGALGPAVLDAGGMPYPSARTFASPLDAAGHALLGRVWPSNPCTRRYRQLDTDASRPRDVDWVSGAALWLRRSALQSVGGWDDRYFMYMEDVDLCWRLRRLGWRVAYEPRVTVTHVGGASTARHPYRMIIRHHRSVYRFAAKRWRGARRLLLPAAALLLSLRAAVALLARRLGARPGGADPAG